MSDFFNYRSPAAGSCNEFTWRRGVGAIQPLGLCQGVGFGGGGQGRPHKRRKKPPVRLTGGDTCNAAWELERVLLEAARILQNVPFANPTRGHGKHDRFYWLGPYLWGNADRPDEIQSVLIFDQERIANGGAARPSDAVADIFREPGRWTLDCATFCQVVLWYAMLHFLGADEFDRRLRQASLSTGGKILLRTHASTGLKILERHSYKGESPDSCAHNDLSERLRLTPSGTVVTFTNTALPSDDPFHNENAIKLTGDRYLAFPISAEPVKRQDIELRLNTRANYQQKTCVSWLLQYQLTE